MLQDECTFLCQTLLSSVNNNNSNNNNDHDADNNNFVDKHIVGAAADLALIVAEQRHQINNNNNNNNTLQQLWNVLQLRPAAAAAASGKGKKEEVLLLKKALNYLAYFLSMDCTAYNHNNSNNHSNSNNNNNSSRNKNKNSIKRAVALRRSVLRNTDALTGLLWLVQHDDLVLALLRGVEPSLNKKDNKEPASPDRSLRSDASSVPPSTPDDSVSSSGSIDPTRLGRMRRRRQQQQQKREQQQQQQQQKAWMTSIPEDFATAAAAAAENNNNSSSSSSSSPKQQSTLVDVFAFSPSQTTTTSMSPQRGRTAPSSSRETRTINALERTHLRLLDSLTTTRTTSVTTTNLDNATCPYNDEMYDSHNMALLALQRIITGKMENSDESCLDYIEQDHHHDSDAGDDDEDDDHSRNPLFLTNQWLSENERAIPAMANILAETLQAAIRMMAFPSKDGNTKPRAKKKKTSKALCAHCQDYLQQRVATCTALMDQACLFHSGNRGAFGEILIPVYVQTLQVALLNTREGVEDATWSAEIGLETLRGLTSLTHENKQAAECLADGPGLSLLVRVLETWVIMEDGDSLSHNKSHKLHYDIILFCLNCLTNCAESAAERTISVLGDLKATSESETLFWTWLTRWLVAQTESFRQAVVSGASERRLEPEERERLVTAGHGFVLLACVIVLSSEGSREVVWKELIGDSVAEKLAFLKKTLIAFLNFYRYSVGDLSLAIVAPIRKLMEQLDGIIAEQ